MKDHYEVVQNIEKGIEELADIVQDAWNIIYAYIIANNHPMHVCECQHCTWARKAIPYVQNK